MMNKNTKIEPLLLGRDPLSAKAVLLGQSPPSGSGPTIALTLVGASHSSLTLGSKLFFWVGTHFRLGSPGAAQNRSRLSSSGASRDRVPEGKNRGPRSAGAPRSHGAPDGGENRGGAPDPPLEAPKGCPLAPQTPCSGSSWDLGLGFPSRSPVGTRHAGKDRGSGLLRSGRGVLIFPVSVWGV